MDQKKMTDGIRTFLEGLDQRFEGDDQNRTPARVAAAWVEDLVAGYATDPEQELSWTSAPDGCGPVLVRRIDFASVCVHHLLPFFGQAYVAYVPAQRLAGLSKIGRVVEAHARRLQTQERLTASIVGTIDRILKPAGAVVMLEAEHTCMTLRGVRKQRSRMTTVATAGSYDTDAAARSEILSLLVRDGSLAR
jgi:GTP cyclohydrolase I